MAVVMDRPRRLDDGRLTAHLLSDQLGEAGVLELIAVAIVVGCHPYALQDAGSYKEHFDLMGTRRVDAARAHPLVREVRRREVGLILRAKRTYAAYGGAVLMAADD